MAKSAAIIGGGVAGIAAAAALSEAGLHVELFEKRPFLGGRASSFADHATGERIDECQHGTMRCCTNLANLLERLGVHDQIRYFDTLTFLDGNGIRSEIKGCGLPAPMHTALSFLLFKPLNLRDKIGIGRAMIAMLRAKPTAQWDAETIAAWFGRMGQTEQAVRRFWRPILVSACNEDLERISVGNAFKIFRDGFLRNPQAFHFGLSKVPMATLYHEPTLAYLKQRGGCVRTKTTVDEIHFADGRITDFTLMDGERIEADYYISGLQCDLLLKMLPPEITAGVPYFENLRQIELSPIAGVHVWFDRPIDCPPALALLDRQTEWIFNKTDLFGLNPNEGTYLSMVISASHRYEGMSKEALLDLVLADVHACLPETQAANVVRSYVIRWSKATIAPKPGSEALRPDQRSPISNLYVAGEWTRTGWPSTMEGAARSGYLAAQYVLADAGIPHILLAPDLPPSLLVRLLGG